MSAPTATPSESSWDALAREAARRREAADEQLDLLQLLSFELDGSPYAVPVERVRVIVRMRPITPVPRTPREVCGVISLRGEIVQVIDLRLRLGLVAGDITKASRIIVVLGDDGRIAGLLVDAVTEVLRVAESALCEAPAREGDSVESLCAKGESFVSVIDLEKVLGVDAGS